MSADAPTIMGDAIPYWLHALTPLHAGAGSGEGAIDLPVVRERMTGWPYVPGSSVKGVIADLRGATEEARKDGTDLLRAFGKSSPDTSRAGALTFTDGRLVCLPVQSLLGTWAWVTSPMALRRLARDLAVCGIAGLPPVQAPQNNESLLVPDQPASALASNGQAYLLDLKLDARTDKDAAQWAGVIGQRVFSGKDWPQLFAERFAIAHDDLFSFLARHGLEVVARVRIDDATGSVADGQLWYEEALPAETILAGIVSADGVRSRTSANRALLETYCSGEAAVQFGGKAGVGRGRTRCVFPAVPAKKGADGK